MDTIQSVTENVNETELQKKWEDIARHIEEKDKRIIIADKLYKMFVPASHMGV